MVGGPCGGTEVAFHRGWPCTAVTVQPAQRWKVTPRLRPSPCHPKPVCVSNRALTAPGHPFTRPGCLGLQFLPPVPVSWREGRDLEGRVPGEMTRDQEEPERLNPGHACFLQH